MNTVKASVSISKRFKNPGYIDTTAAYSRRIPDSFPALSESRRRTHSSSVSESLLPFRPIKRLFSSLSSSRSLPEYFWYSENLQ